MDAGASPVGAAPEVGAVVVGGITVVGSAPVETPVGVDGSEIGGRTGGITPPVDVAAVLVKAGSVGRTTELGIPPVLPADEGTTGGISGVGSFGSSWEGSAGFSVGG